MAADTQSSIVPPITRLRPARRFERLNAVLIDRLIHFSIQSHVQTYWRANSGVSRETASTARLARWGLAGGPSMMVRPSAGFPIVGLPRRHSIRSIQSADSLSHGAD
jgi:hypothetical protein